MACPPFCCRGFHFGALLLAISYFGQVSAIHAQETTKGGSMPPSEQIAKGNITFKVIKAEGESFGYDVFVDGKRFIHQPTIPGQPGTSGFIKKSDAEKVAQLVVRKIKNREIPPAITEEELKRLKVID